MLGTGDLSELALGWSTYDVGDQMSHYNVNGGVPKTLVQHLIRWVISSKQFDDAVADVLASVLDTEITPELVPTDDEHPAQSSEATVGPLPAAGLHAVPGAAPRDPPVDGRVPRLACLARRDRRTVAARLPRRRPRRLLAARDPAVAAGLRPPLLRVQPVQALRPAERTEGVVRRGHSRPAATGAPRRTCRPAPGSTRSSARCPTRSRRGSVNRPQRTHAPDTEPGSSDRMNDPYTDRPKGDSNRRSDR